MKCISVGALKTSLIGLFMDTKQYQLFVVLKYVFLLHFLKENKWDTQKKKRKLILLQSQSSNYIIQISSEF